MLPPLPGNSRRTRAIVVVAVCFTVSMLGIVLLPSGPDRVAPPVPQSASRYIRDPASAPQNQELSIPPAALYQVDLEDARYPHSVDPRTFLTPYADSVLVDYRAWVCDTPAPPDAIIVAVDGRDGAAGTVDDPLASINEAVGRVQPGQNILVRQGQYDEAVLFSAKNGEPDAWITLRSYPGERATLIADVGWNSVAVRRGSSYINIACLEMAGPTQRPEAIPSDPNVNRDRRLQGQGAEQNPINYGAGVNIGDQADTREGRNPHHIRVIANEIYDFTEAGVTATETSHVTVAGNITYRNSKYGCHSGSGIAIGFMVNVGGDDNPDGYSNYVIGNVTYANENISYQCFSDDLGATLTDGNGIIVDLNRRSDYQGRTLIADNLAFGNGGRGIMVFKSDHVDVVNNVAFHNAFTELFGRSGGHPDIAVAEASDVRVYNNIAVPRDGNIAYRDNDADVDVRANVFTDAGNGANLFAAPSTDPGSDFGLVPEAVTNMDTGIPFLTTVTQDGLLTSPAAIGPIYNTTLDRS